MDITNDQRDQAYETATEEQKYLYAHPESGQRMRSIANKHNIVSGELYKAYALLIGDIILNLKNRSELPKLLTETLSTSLEESKKIANDLEAFLDRKPSTSTDLATDIAEIESSLQQAQPKSIPQIRTMAADMDRAQATTDNEPTHSSSQEDLLRKNNPGS